MSLPPERISVKRRRQEEPVDTLFLEHTAGPKTKRRATDFYFQRVQDSVIAPISQREVPASPAKANATPDLGIPSVRWTSPGDAKRDYEKLKASVKAHADQDAQDAQIQTPGPAVAATVDGGSRSAPSTPRALHNTRRFHLARHLSPSLKPNAPSGVRKHKSFIRPPLATFIERHAPTFTHEQNPLYGGTPVDKMVDVGPVDPSRPTDPSDLSRETLENSKRTATNTFLQARSATTRNGTSIRDHPSTWNHDSDQLAEELAALAMDFDPELQEKVAAEQSKLPTTPPIAKDIVMSTHEQDDDFVYETYIRIRYDEAHRDATDVDLDPNFGVLVIDEEDEDLWQKYVDSDDETDWDEEDSNAEDNPANDYPEDEVSSDDEYGYSAYDKYRSHGSDHETFDSPDDADDRW